ncbi:MAG: hypothetical protein KDJ47_13260 [Hyphomicrobiaceae bacterium]|nr:hypothetical protein [Hyphomicrobiaceae bacterium]
MSNTMGHEFTLPGTAGRRPVHAHAGWMLLLAPAFFFASCFAAAAVPTPLMHLEGRWSGWGAITLSSGKSEQVKCIATYFVRNEGGQLEQNLRCASVSYRIDSKAELEVASDKVHGRWQERANSAEGSVYGRMTGSGFNLAIHGDNFTAVMAVSTSSCKQSINIAPEGTEIRRIAIGLDKC